MKRQFENNLINWKKNGMKKPLMVIGARQTGKTYIIEKFIKEHFEESLSFNIEREEAIKDIFERTIDAEKIIEELELYLGKKIDIEKTVIFFDEVQESERLITSLKYFCESEKPYKIICAGSLFGVKLERLKKSFPVGKVKMEYMYPLNFEEFLIAIGKNILRDKIIECYKTMTPMPDFAHEEAINLYRKYLCVGGMPEAVNNFVENDLDILRFDSSILSDIKVAYIADMKKHVETKAESIKIEAVYNNIPEQLSKENKNFQYTLLEKNARGRKYRSPINWLISAKLILMANNIKRVEKPLKIYKDNSTFKLYLSDVGLLSNASEVTYREIINDEDFIFKGAITENYVAQELASYTNSLYFWLSNGEAEVNFLLSTPNDGIIPIEVKSGINNKSKSLNVYVEQNHPKYSIRFSARNFGFENNIKSIPLYAVFCLNNKNI